MTIATNDRAAKAHRNRESAMSAFITKKAEIDAALARLQRLSDDQFYCDPDALNWGHVGMVEGFAAALKAITDAAFNEGEYAE